MIKIIILSLIIAASKGSCQSSGKDSCQRFTEYVYAPEGKFPIVHDSNNYISLFFEAGFKNDSLGLLVNNKFYTSLQLTSHHLKHNTFKHLDIPIENKTSVITIKIFNYRNGKCAEFNSRIEYGNYFIRKYENDWVVEYSNFYREH